MNSLPMISVAAQVTLVAAIAVLAASRLKSAAHRHSVLLAALLCILASPFFFAGTVWTGLALKLPILTAAQNQTEPASSPNSPTSISSQQGQHASEQIQPADSVNSTELETSASSQPRDASSTAVVSKQHNATLPTFQVDVVIASIWCLGTLFFCMGIIRSYAKTRLLLKSSRPVRHEIDASIIAQASTQLGATCPLRVGTTGKVAGPVVIGLLHPWILIPARYLETLSSEELLQVLIHEGAHAIRKDPLLALTQQICKALFWWHPLIHLLNRQLTSAREEVCDNFVLAHAQPVAYGTTLLKLATLSPATASLSMAIGMFDGRESLEDRIRGLLDTNRPRITRVRSLTAVSVVSAFALFSLAVIATRVTAQDAAQPADSASRVVVPKSPTPELADTTPVDPKAFRLILTYHGASDKPFYNLALSAQRGAQQKNPFALFEPIDEEQAGRIIRFLKESQFFKNARIPATQDDPTTGPQYLLRVWTGEGHFEETLGWDIGTLLRLDRLRKSLDGKPADAMDQLLQRLEGQRKLWESGSVANDLKTRLFQPDSASILQAGQPIPIMLELSNVGQIARIYDQHRFILSGTEFVVRDEFGRRVPYMAGGAGLRQTQATIEPGESKIIEECDLSSFYYLRRPGRYVISFQAAGLPPSNAMHIQVAPSEGPPADGDPMAKLLNLNSSKWTLIGNPNAVPKMRPGQNRVETSGWQFLFADREKGVKGSKFAVWLWLTNAPAEELPPGENNPPAPSESLGKISQWYAYLYVSPEALTVWPTVKQDIMKALDGTLQIPQHQSRIRNDDPVDRLKPLVQEGWSIGASQPNLELQPGSNWGGTTGQIIRFVRNPPAHKGEGLINLWLADEPAAAKPVNNLSSVPTSEYLGKLDRWHVYILASQQALAAWPTAKEDIKSRLAGQATDDDYRRLQDRYKARVLSALREGKQDQLAAVTDEFNASIGGKLLHVQVVSRTGPIAKHTTLLSKFYGQRKISIGKINYAVATKPYVTQNANEEGYVLIATNPLAGQKWPDDLQIVMAMDPVPAGADK